VIAQAEINAAVKAAADALSTVSADTPDAIARLAGQVLLTQELRTAREERDAIPQPIDGDGGFQ